MPVTDQGADNGRYSVIPRTLIFLTRGNKVLLLKGSPQKRLWANLYNGVGGHIEPGEDVLSAARRELCEETGLEPDNLNLRGVILVDTAMNPGIAIFVLSGTCSTGEPLPSEEGYLEWVDVNDLNSYPLVEDLYSLLPKVLQMKKDDPPFSGHYWYDEDNRLNISFAS
ncbi:MAG: NUDIX domain-containing protein [Chloroflexi bacterium]|nr:MAG: NUDIX domain-containing protein [Chloroflexota bacterium]